MPCIKHDAAAEIIEDEEDYNINFITYDSDGLPCILPDEYNLSANETRKKWYDQVDEHIVCIWKEMQTYIRSSEIPVLENCTFPEFVSFICRHSYKIPFNCEPDQIIYQDVLDCDLPT